MDLLSSSVQLLTFNRRALESWLEKNRRLAYDYLFEYFTIYEGRHFEYFRLRADHASFTPWDVLALSSLSVNLKATTVKSLLVSEKMHLDEALIRVRNEIEKEPEGHRQLWTLRNQKIIQSGSELSNLYYQLMKINGIGPVSTSKLMAAKFPDLVPIRDSKVGTLLQAGEQWWEPMADVMQSDIIRGILVDEMPELPSAQPIPGLLRRFDVVLWMHAKK